MISRARQLSPVYCLVVVGLLSASPAAAFAESVTSAPTTQVSAQPSARAANLDVAEVTASPTASATEATAAPTFTTTSTSSPIVPVAAATTPATTPSVPATTPSVARTAKAATPVKITVFADLNGNKSVDQEEPLLAQVPVLITPSIGEPVTVTTDGSGVATYQPPDPEVSFEVAVEAQTKPLGYDYPTKAASITITADQTSAVLPVPITDLDCKDFATDRAAQDYFEKYDKNFGDVAELDGDDDGNACDWGTQSNAATTTGTPSSTATSSSTSSASTTATSSSTRLAHTGANAAPTVLTSLALLTGGFALLRRRAGIIEPSEQKTD